MTIEYHTGLGKEVADVYMRKNIPYAVQFELTSRCNLKCRHCYMDIEKDYCSELSTEEVIGIIDQLVDIGTFYLGFTGGEIFTRKDLFEITEYANKKGFFITFMTNGTLIKPEFIEEIEKLGPIKFEISLYGATPETHDYITRVKGSFESTIAAIEGLVQHGINVTTKTSLMNLNVHESGDIKALCDRLGVFCKLTPGMTPHRDGSLDPLKYDLSFEDMDTYLSADDFSLTYLTEERDNDPKKRFKCKAGKAICAISSSGIVFPCAAMPMAVGDLRKKNLKEIWHTDPNDDLKRLRDITSEDLPKCSRCDLAEFCIRCPGVIYLETGDFTGASENTCKYAQWRKHLKDTKDITVT
ncbi:MAG: radical SAM protein [Halobacteriota archaeon]|nr:radical SAM protein [Halobacteriota archaeon]